MEGDESNGIGGKLVGRTEDVGRGGVRAVVRGSSKYHSKNERLGG